MSSPSHPWVAPESRAQARGRAVAAVAVGILAGLGATRCNTGPDGLQLWGSYSTQRLLLGDSCKAEDAGNACFDADDTINVTLSALLDGGGIVLARNTAPPAIGRQQGDHFEFYIDSADGGFRQTVCGCQVQVIETIWGQLYGPDAGLSEVVPPVDGGPTDGGSAGTDAGATGSSVDAGAGGTGPDAGLSSCGYFDPIEPPGNGGADWFLGIDAGYDLTNNYRSFHATLIDEITVLDGGPPPDAGCTCHACKVVYDLSGSE